MAFAVNIDPAESDPASLTRQELEARFGKRPLNFCENPGDLAETIHRLREGTSLWNWFLAAVLVGLVFEVLLANRKASQAAGGQLPQPNRRPRSAQKWLRSRSAK
jgi:hypothetical protein